MRKDKESLIGVVDPKPGSTIMIYDVHASESGALAILDDLYRQIRTYPDKSIRWIFVVSIPEYEECENIVVCRFPWVKTNWGFRAYFEYVVARTLLKKYNPDKVFSLQNKGISFYHKEQIVYLHLPFILSNHRFKIKQDGKKLWAYQNIVSKLIFNSLRKVDCTIVQTQWMREELIKKAKLSTEKIIVQKPDISMNNIGRYLDSAKSRHTFFYPATAFSYKNHMTLLKALKYAQDNGLKDYSLILTIEANENELAERLNKYAIENHLIVNFAGKLSRESVFELYTHSVLVFPSYVESFGLPLLEAKLTGSYIIASDCSFSREILKGYDKADFFQELDYKKMGEYILKISSV